MQKVLFVCLGNICRSPLAEAVFVHKINELGLGGKFYAESCGTADYHIGSPPDPRTIKNALKNGVKMDHACRQLCPDDFERFDHVFVMDRNNLRAAQKMAGAHYQHKISLMRTFDPDGPDLDVPDPYYGDESAFQEVFEILQRTIGSFLATAGRPRPGD